MKSDIKIMRLNFMDGIASHLREILHYLTSIATPKQTIQSVNLHISFSLSILSGKQLLTLGLCKTTATWGALLEGQCCRGNSLAALIDGTHLKGDVERELLSPSMGRGSLSLKNLN